MISPRLSSARMIGGELDFSSARRLYRYRGCRLWARRAGVVFISLDGGMSADGIRFTRYSPTADKESYCRIAAAKKSGRIPVPLAHLSKQAMAGSASPDAFNELRAADRSVASPAAEAGRRPCIRPSCLTASSNCSSSNAIWRPELLLTLMDAGAALAFQMRLGGFTGAPLCVPYHSLFTGLPAGCCSCVLHRGGPAYRIAPDGHQRGCHGKE